MLDGFSHNTNVTIDGEYLTLTIPAFNSTAVFDIYVSTCMLSILFFYLFLLIAHLVMGEPVIDQITADRGYTGEIFTISGSNFGAGAVFIDNVTLPSKQIISWTYNEIIFVLPGLRTRNSYNAFVCVVYFIFLYRYLLETGASSKRKIK